MVTTAEAEPFPVCVTCWERGKSSRWNQIFFDLFTLYRRIYYIVRRYLQAVDQNFDWCPASYGRGAYMGFLKHVCLARLQFDIVHC